MAGISTNADVFVFDDRSGMAVLREDLNTVVVYTSSIKDRFPVLYTLLNSQDSSITEIKVEASNQGLFNVDYKY